MIYPELVLLQCTTNIFGNCTNYKKTALSEGGSW